MKKLKLTLPKGSLEKNTYKLFQEAGLDLGTLGRSYRPKTADSELEIKILRPQEIPTMIAQAAHDLGISGEDWKDETKADIEKLLDLEYGLIKLVLAVPESWIDVNNLDDLLFEFVSGIGRIDDYIESRVNIFDINILSMSLRMDTKIEFADTIANLNYITKNNISLFKNTVTELYAEKKLADLIYNQHQKINK